ncbi:MAG: hypothetical protein HY207_05030 [Nitrospirae bacterium]|nr:hypothetical protein [Nitrospirota bacterium]
MVLFVVLGLLSGIALVFVFRATRGSTTPIRAGVLLAVGPSAKGDPYAVAQGAVTHGEAVLLDVGAGEFVFFVNRPEAVLALVNGCGVRVRPTVERRLPVLVEARFHTRSVPPYVVKTPSIRYRFEGPPVSPAASCG